MSRVSYPLGVEKFLEEGVDAFNNLLHLNSDDLLKKFILYALKPVLLERGYLFRILDWNYRANFEKSLVIFIYIQNRKVMDCYIYNVDDTHLGVYIVTKIKIHEFKVLK